jgi:hypothetical protein
MKTLLSIVKILLLILAVNGYIFFLVFLADYFFNNLIFIYWLILGLVLVLFYFILHTNINIKQYYSWVKVVVNHYKEAIRNIIILILFKIILTFTINNIDVSTKINIKYFSAASDLFLTIILFLIIWIEITKLLIISKAKIPFLHKWLSNMQFQIYFSFFILFFMIMITLFIK